MTASGLPFLVVERYDRDPTTDPIRRLHQEDLCQALGHPADRKSQSEGGLSVVDCIGLLRDATSVPAQELPRFWAALVFNWAIGNRDAHAKNFSLLYDGGAPTLAPLYDLVSTVAYPPLTTRLAMSIDGAARLEDAGLGAWLELAVRSGLSERLARRSCETLLARLQQEARRLAVDARHANEMAASIAARIASLELA